MLLMKWTGNKQVSVTVTGTWHVIDERNTALPMVIQCVCVCVYVYVYVHECVHVCA